MKKIDFPLKDEKILEKIKAWDEVKITGKIFVARDAGCKRIVEMIKQREKIPIELKNSLIYYMAPTPAPPGKIIGSAGPTTSIRMDKNTIPLLKTGVKATMGKGNRGKIIVEACKKYKAVYFITYGGCGAYLSKFIKSCKVVAFEEFGPESIYEIEVENFPAIVCIDIYGNNLYDVRP